MIMFHVNLQGCTGICHEAPHSWSLLQLQSLSWTSAGRWKIDEFTGREVMDLPPETPLKNFSYILAAGIFWESKMNEIWD